eukprot:3939106-Rhodomonas_salina.2
MHGRFAGHVDGKGGGEGERVCVSEGILSRGGRGRGGEGGQKAERGGRWLTERLVAVLGTTR